jgi:hypothetical protein
LQGEGQEFESPRLHHLTERDRSPEDPGLSEAPS